MRKLLGVLTIACSPVFAAYSYYFTDTLTSINTSNWTQNGTLTAGSGGLTSSNANGGSLISKVSVPDGSSNYEVKTTLTLTASGGTYVTYLRASSNAMSGPAAAGTTYAFEIQNPTFSGSACTATLAAYKIVSAAVTTLGTTTVPCGNGMTVRTVHVALYNQMALYVNNALYYWVEDSSIASGQPGIGVRGAPSGNSISEVQLGGIYAGAPTMAPTNEIGVSAFSNRIEMQWPGATEPNGPGVAFYQILRNGAWVENITESAFVDPSLTYSTNYTYSIIAEDFDLNETTETFTAATPPQGDVDARETGLRPTGSYWGGGGEQIDMLSGNLNYTTPMIKAMWRGGWSIGFNLTYNSQNWRQDPAGIWQLGEDVGYGYGWKFLTGSLLPLVAPGYVIGEYLFTDSTGAQYHLNKNNGSGLWTSTEGIYVTFDANTNILHFNDGSFWVMGCTSAGSEWDAGTMYPTTIEDSNGNQVFINYNDGLGVTWTNSSSRIKNIEDVRGNGSHDYTFTYNTDAIPHLTGITNNIGTSENYSFTYTENYSLNSPFSGNTNFGTVTLLASSTATGIPLTTYFTYDTTAATTSCNSVGTGTSGAGLLTQVTTPYCGHLRWTYIPTPFNGLAGSRLYIEIQNRYLSMSSGAGETGIGLVRVNDSSNSVHSSATLQDSPANAEKYWTFQTNTAQFNGGLETSYEELTLSTGAVLSYQNFSWAQTPTTLNPYIGTTLTKLDPNQTYEADKQTTQVLDQYGNLLTMWVHNFGAGAVGPLARTYNNTYLGGTNYTSRYILSRLLTSTVTDGTNTTTLASNTYDNGMLNTNSTYTCVGYGASLCEHDTANYPYTFYYRGDLSQSIAPAATTTYGYDMTGSVLSTTVNGVTTSVTSSSTNNFAVPSQITTNSLSSTMNWTSALGLSSATGPNGDSGSINYDSNARPHQTTSPYGAVTTYAYGDTASPPYKSATTNGHDVYTYMDGFGRTTQTVTGDQATTFSNVKTQYAPCGCSPLGKLSQQSQPFATGDTPVWTVYTYDASGRTLTVTLPDGSATHYLYQGNTVKVTDPAGKYKIFTMDALGNLTQVQEPDPALGTVTTTYSYDILNHLIQVSMPRETSGTQTRTFNYTVGTTVTAFLQSATNPENSTVSYTYNASNLLASKTDAKGQQLTYQYDNYNRLTSLTWANAPGGAQVLRTYYYDTNPLQSGFSQNALGRLTAVKYPDPLNRGSSDPIQLVDMYSYTAPGTPGAGLPATKRLQVNQSYTYLSGGSQHNASETANLDSTFTYNNEGKITSMTYPSTSSGTTTTPGPSYNYSYDSMYRLSGMTSGSTTVVNGVTYNAANQLLAMTFNGINETRGYNALNQLTTLTSGSENLTYIYPTGTNNGKISSMISGETVTYTYDSLNRLATAAGSGWSETYGYDPFGNLLSKTGANAPALSQTVNPANNQNGLGYDANGNALSTSIGGSANLNYDVENHISSVYNGSSYLSYYAYDAQNRRIFSWNGSQDSQSNPISYTLNVYSPGGQKLAAYTVSPSLNYVYPNYIMQVALASSDQYFGGRRLAVMDQLGSEQNSNQSYFPWGEPKGSSNSQDTWNFATYWADSATGLDYANNRYYTSAYGRFMTPDPYTNSGRPSDPQSWNRYAYTRGDPVNRADPAGTCDLAVALWADGIPAFTNCDPSLGPDFNPSAYAQCMATPGCYTPLPGGGNPAATNSWTLQNQGLQGLTTTALNTLSAQCQSAIGTSNLNKTLQNVNNLNFFNGTLQSQGMLTENQLVGNGNNTEIGTSVAASGGAAIVLVTASGVQSNDIVLGGQFVSPTTTLAQQMAVLVHEALHSGLNLGDTALAAALNLSLPAGATPDDASSAISQFIFDNCPKSMQNK